MSGGWPSWRRPHRHRQVNPSALGGGGAQPRALGELVTTPSEELIEVTRVAGIDYPHARMRMPA